MGDISGFQQHGHIQRNEAMDLCHLSPNQAASLLKRLKAEGKLVQHGVRRGAYYTRGRMR